MNTRLLSFPARQDDRAVAGRVPKRSVLRVDLALFALVMVAASVCAMLTSTLYASGVMLREAASEARFVNAAVRRGAMENVFHGRRDGSEARLVSLLLRPGVHAARVIGITGEVLAGEEAVAEGSRIEEEPALERALRGEPRTLGGAWRWAIPFRSSGSGRNVEFLLPVFNDAGASVIGAVALRRSPGPASDAAASVVDSIWGTYLGFTALLYFALLAAFRVGSLREASARAFGGRTDPREIWPRIEEDLRARAAFRRIVVRATVDPAQPKLAVDTGLLGVVLQAFAAHALQCARDGDLLLLHVKALACGVEFAYAVPGAPSAAFCADAPGSRTTAALARAVNDAGGALTLQGDPERGPRVVVTLPA
jgi:hypothetical protein